MKDLEENGKGTVRIQTKAGTPDNRNARLERQRTMDFALGGEHLLGAIAMDWHASYAKASEERPNERYIDFQLKKQEFDMDLSDERQPFATLQRRFHNDPERQVQPERTDRTTGRHQRTRLEILRQLQNSVQERKQTEVRCKGST